jgi:hypothetical protein
VDHFAVARACPRAEARGSFEDEHLAARERELTGDRKAHHTGADYDRIDLVHDLASVAPGARAAAWLKTHAPRSPPEQRLLREAVQCAGPQLPTQRRESGCLLSTIAWKVTLPC